MDGSGIKALKLNDNDTHAAKPKSREIGRITAMGYDTKLPHDDVQSALRKYFSSCGEITDCYIPVKNNILYRYAFIYFRGEGAVDKALKLSGTDVGGWNVIVKAKPFPKSAGRFADVLVKGYDTSRSKIDIERELTEHFSSCGEVDEVTIYESLASASVSIVGEGADDKAVELNGSYMGGRRLLVKLIGGRGIYSVHSRRRYVGRPYCLGKMAGDDSVVES